MTTPELRALIGRLDATLRRPQMLAVPVDVGDVRAILRLLRAEMLATAERMYPDAWDGAIFDDGTEIDAAYRTLCEEMEHASIVGPMPKPTPHEADLT